MLRASKLQPNDWANAPKSKQHPAPSTSLLLRDPPDLLGCAFRSITCSAELPLCTCAPKIAAKIDHELQVCRSAQSASCSTPPARFDEGLGNARKSGQEITPLIDVEVDDAFSSGWQAQFSGE
jgi:hypothetical protein